MMWAFGRGLVAAAFAMLCAFPGWAQTPVEIHPTFTAFQGATVGTGHGQVLAVGQVKTYLMLHNPSSPGGNTIWCAFGVTAVANAAGTVEIAPGQYVTWESSSAPRSAIDCIASGSSTPLTIGIN